MPRSSWLLVATCCIAGRLAAQVPAPAQAAPTIALRVGRLVNPENGTAAANQVILVQNGRFTAIGANVTIPADAKTIDLSRMTVTPGLVDAHNHLGLTYKDFPEHNSYYLTYIAESSQLRAIQAASNGMQMLASGFTVVRDVGNNAHYVDIALMQAVEQGWLPGPTIIPSGLIIGGLGGQFNPTWEMELDHKITYPEYLEADTRDEIIKAVRQNMLFGAKVIKICVDCKRWGYSVDDMKLFVEEAAKGGIKVAGHVQTAAGAQRAIDAGIWSIEHSSALNDTLHKKMAARGIFGAGTETPITDGHANAQAYERTKATLKNAWDNKVKLTFSTDADYYVYGKTRGEVAIEFIRTWKEAGVPAPDILKAMTITGYQVSQLENTRGPIAVGYPADLIAMAGNPLTDIDALRDVQFVMKDGQVYKQNGVVDAYPFLHGGPVYGRGQAAAAAAAAAARGAPPPPPTGRGGAAGGGRAGRGGRAGGAAGGGAAGSGF